MNNISNISIEITRKCNLSCSYCYLGSNKENVKIQKKTIINSIMFLLKDAVVEKKNPIIFFMGGEPLLDFSLIKWSVQKCRKLELSGYPRILFRITTNGTRITTKIANFLKKENFRVTLSLDGDEVTHNKFRKNHAGKGSYNRLIKSLYYLQKIGVDYTIRATLTRNSLNITNIFNTFSLLDIHSYMIINAYVAGNGNNRICIQTNDIKTVVDSKLELFFYFIESNESLPIDLELLNLFFRIVNGNMVKNPCDAGCRYCGIDINGDVVPCHRFFGNKDFISRNVNSCSSELPMLYFEKDVSKRELCENCSINYLCGGTCYYESYVKYKNPYRTDKTTCLYNKTLIYGMLKYTIHLFRVNPERIISIYEKYSTKNNDNLVIIKSMTNINKMSKINAIEIKDKRFSIVKDMIRIDLQEDGIIYSNKNMEYKYIVNVTSLAILDLLDGKLTASEISLKVAIACEVNVVDIEEDIYKQLATFQELGFIEEVKETAESNA